VVVYPDTGLSQVPPEMDLLAVVALPQGRISGRLRSAGNAAFATLTFLAELQPRSQGLARLSL
jgi:hypothetical protein